MKTGTIIKATQDIDIRGNVILKGTIGEVSRPNDRQISILEHHGVVACFKFPGVESFVGDSSEVEPV